ncbi:MAG TPA: DUF456 domain-containing protein [Thermoflexales bacterium]|nr:DUF456 domain-containing protein [Thermoflexales bacterium]HQW34336.1 DUF456 domain-containing protein [Thermoflexales bacterium]HQZ21936.1 DUF456 domain-containing protein [Thermoflexales bacterium]HQZ98818.1 DUF456 domain-containing protein [Thermoflexales bacterium]
MQTQALQSLALLIIFVGFIGAILPMLPGPPLIWVGAFVWALADGFQRVGAPALIILFVLMALATASDLAMSAAFAKQSGASWKTILASILGGIGGAAVLAEIPVIGSIFGAVIGSVLAVVAVEYAMRRDRAAALKASKAYLMGCVVSQLVDVGLSALMILIFAWQAFWK